MTDEQNLNKEALEQKDADGAEEETSFIEELFQSEAEEQEEVRPPKLINKNPPSEAERL